MVKPKVFFSAPATQNKEEISLYQSILDCLKDLGFAITYDWLHDKEDYDIQSTTKKSILAIEISDLVVAENTTSSTGVGSQIALAQSKKVPVIILTRKKLAKKGSFFSLSEFGPDVKMFSYSSQNLATVLTKATGEVTKERLAKFNFISTPKINQKIKEESDKLNLSKSEYLRKILIDYFKL